MHWFKNMFLMLLNAMKSEGVREGDDHPLQEELDPDWCSFAVRSPATAKKRNPMPSGVPYGIMIHTTGRGVISKAVQRGTTPVDEALNYYLKTCGVHYLNGYDGTLIQMLPDDRFGAHAGVSEIHRKKMLSGEWKRDFSINVVSLWEKRWPGVKSPQHLFPTTSPNGSYIGVENVPKMNLQYTDAQYETLIQLCFERGLAHNWPEGWHRTSRLLCHEDTSPYTRWDSGGGWDPGALRESPRFDWDRLVEGIDRLVYA